ncbi:putative Zn finger protein [Encephalitozoon cuniculi GB-M1]|uniref:Zn finger protein n=2 Tax=Encephalitozoon cuniculi TaxID=6035 RepID=Q8STU2_ENCCU|nr:E3 ubiquitin-protein ligase RAD18 [Encephalitozoon cuniculi GB-M1]AGE96470.1 putative zn finger protein [Encephalitozoon cuniculi]KMV65425.1 RING-finger-containing E3 ubiquitin ligase [Encephalitozoon cuniculi EcunIII-L]UYI26747.1 E3 ubiquitin-protein ligase [Encephalitozoon cuniculi]CAD27035.1 putative Zn finger protein [Encephalitozoon cuniculi GB-M1]
MDLCRICDCRISIRCETTCGHGFCYLCIKRHLGTQDFCPVCREDPCFVREPGSSGSRWDNEGHARNGDLDRKVLESLCRLKRYIKEERVCRW